MCAQARPDGRAVRAAHRAAGEREDWWVDPEAAVGAELGAAQGISTWMALAQAHRGVVLADRLPKVAALAASSSLTTAIWVSAQAARPRVRRAVSSSPVTSQMSTSGPQVVEILALIWFSWTMPIRGTLTIGSRKTSSSLGA